MGRILDAELTRHLGYEREDPVGQGSGNSGNGRSRKALLTENGRLPISVPRDRGGRFEPQLVKST